MHVLVTGSTGFIGSHIVRVLRREGHEVRAMHRSTSDLTLLEGLELELVEGDVTEPASLRAAMEDVDAVVNCAGFISLWNGHEDALHRVNVEGAYNVVEAAKAQDVDRLVHTSSIAAVGPPQEGEVADESNPWPGDHGVGYFRTKRRGEEVVLGNARRGALDAVVVNPGTAIGPRDVNWTGGYLIRSVVKDYLPGAPGGGTNFVDVRDVAEGHVRALHKGRTGERYILGGENRSFVEMYELIGDVTGAEPPGRVIPYPIAWASAWWQETKARFQDRRPYLNRAQVRATYLDIYVDSSRAEDELGVEARPVRESVEDAYAWYVDEGML